MTAKIIAEQATKKLFIGFNWKMNPSSLFDAKKLFEIYTIANFERKDNGSSNFSPVLFVPSLYFSFLQSHNPSNIKLGAQDISNKEGGALTGQISSLMLASIDCKYSLVGHSETVKEYQLNTDKVRDKMAQAFENDIIPILCISGLVDIWTKLGRVFDDRIIDLIQKKSNQNFGTKRQPLFVVAFEPTANIGTGQALNQSSIQKNLTEIEEFLKSKNIFKETDPVSGHWVGQYISIYGGSVNSDNIKELSKIESVDGFLLGGASLNAEQIQNIFRL